jgi:hypothetical protein
MRTSIIAAIAMAAALPIAACQSTGENGESGTSTGATSPTSTGSASAGGSGSGGQTGGGGLVGDIPSLVNVNLRNVLNDLAIRLNIDRANIPVNAQIPINVAANVCGVSINILSVSTGGQASCTATTASAELAQSVQQQVAAGGSVGGGAQGGSSVSTGTSGATGGSATGATGTTGTSSGYTEGGQPNTSSAVKPPS